MSVNSAVTTSDRRKNCAMCTMAAVLRRDTSYVQQVIGSKRQDDEALQAAWQIDSGKEDLFIRITDKIFRFLYIELRKSIDPWMAYRSGTGYAELHAALTLGMWMNRFAVGTRFAVWGSSNEPVGMLAHWNYAWKRGADDIEFVDYQYNHGANPPKTSERFIAPEGQDVMTDEQYKSFLALAYTTTPDRALKFA
jgi:hypothetical protein